MLTALRRELKKVRGFSVESIGDIAIIMPNGGKLFKLHGAMLTLGILMDAIEAGTIAFWRVSGIWMPFAAGMCIVAGLGVWISVLYCRHTAYICPQRHETFTPKFKARFWARYTPKSRRLAAAKECARRSMPKIGNTKTKKRIRHCCDGCVFSF